MVGLNPVLSCLMAMELGLSRGDSIRDSLMIWHDKSTHATALGREFQSEALRFLRRTESCDSSDSNFRSIDIFELRCKTIYRQTFFSILLEGIRGDSILPRLRELRLEIEAQLELDMKAHVESLPLKMLVPLLLGMFPAFLILLLGPITKNFLEALR